ncbi:hypothetical protein TRVL_10009 [Trypanosoma vivax]|uniref:Uncharacterized protein n=1 Tax=Trypanosoma vivax (strain Y486) TaxID=1055687 RepID=G0TSB0_TRYVY|nr:hypothetical protein TRVL_10009 [Trypanosoma vivax]CCC46836.1 conserved hypothetical protein [Trypanosoma vivax Y486]
MNMTEELNAVGKYVLDNPEMKQIAISCNSKHLSVPESPETLVKVETEISLEDGECANENIGTLQSNVESKSEYLPNVKMEELSESEVYRKVQPEGLVTKSCGSLHTQDKCFVVDFQSTNNYHNDIIKAWLLTPLALQEPGCEVDMEDFTDSLLHLAEDKMYLYGLYERPGRATLTETRRVNRKRRINGDNICTSASSRSNNTHFTGASSSCGSVSFSFVNWALDPQKDPLYSEKSQPPTIAMQTVLSPEEKYVFSRYALSNGKLRKECADPYQFFTIRLQELRHRVEQEFASNTNKEN